MLTQSVYVCVCMLKRERVESRMQANIPSIKESAPEDRSKPDYCIPLFAKLCIKESLRERGRVKVLGVLYRLVNSCY